ncbi:hypothetical protein KW785_00340 [Candidatus Parcubacteria bacterium]|nr:hypothetical protein [Candidatus Parcubacteria bacterium]
MNPDERGMLERALKLSEENNKILRKMQRTARWAAVWGVIKFLVLIIPLIVGYLYLEPYLKGLEPLFKQAQTVFSGETLPR